MLEEYSLTYNDTPTNAKYQIKTETTTTNYGGTEVETIKAYDYDELGRLEDDNVSVTVDGGTPTITNTHYEYDDAGNRTSMTQGSNTRYYYYNAYDQLLCTDTDSYRGDGLTSYTKRTTIMVFDKLKYSYNERIKTGNCW